MEKWWSLDTNVEAVKLMVTELNADVNVKDTDSVTAFMKLCTLDKCLDADFLRVLVANHGADVNDRDEGKRTPLALFCASEEPDAALIRVLIENGADVNARGGTKTSLMTLCASDKPNAVILDMLVESGADVDARYSDGGTSLMRAARNGSLRTAKMLLDMKANPLLQDKDGRTALEHASLGDCYEEMKKLLDSSQMTRNDTLSAVEERLCHASKEGDLDLVTRLVVDRSVSVNFTDDDQGLTPLDLATRNGHTVIVKFLLERGAEVDAKVSGESTALLFAASEGNLETAEALLHAGASVQKSDKSGSTPLMLACQNDHADMVKSGHGKNNIRAVIIAV